MQLLEPHEGMSVYGKRFGIGKIVYENFQSGHPNDFKICFNGSTYDFCYEVVKNMVNNPIPRK